MSLLTNLFGPHSLTRDLIPIRLPTETEKVLANTMVFPIASLTLTCV